MMANQRSRRREWDPMSDDYNDTYDAQYDDDNAEDQVQLEHTKLYIINIPQGLNEEGIRAAFSKYGRVVFVKLNTPANKRFAFVQYETASEAKLAMMKMNGVEPLNLRISIAHKTRRQVGTKLNSDNRERTNQTRNASSSKDGSSVSSKNWKPRNLDEVSNNGEVDDMLADDQETNIEFELDQLALEQLKVKEEQILCKRRLLLRHAEKKQALAHHGTTRSILPDGRIIVRNNLDTVDSSEMDTGYVAGGCESSETLCSCRTKTCDRASEGTSSATTCVDCTGDDKAKSLTRYKTDLKSFDSKMTMTEPSRRNEPCNCDVCDLVSDGDDETIRLIQLRNIDYAGVVEQDLKIVVALAQYPRHRMKLRQMEQFQRSLNNIIEMQLQHGLLREIPSFVDYYLNHGAIVVVCKDRDTRDWIVRVAPGIEERMREKIIILKSIVKRVYLAVLKIPLTCWPTTATDVFKLLQYFNPSLKTSLWNIYNQKVVDDVELTSVILDRISGEIIRGFSFKNIIDYSQMDFELLGQKEIYYENLLSSLDEDVSSVSSRVKLLEEIKSGEPTPTGSQTSLSSKGEKLLKVIEPKGSHNDNKVGVDELKRDLEGSLQQEVLDKLKDVLYMGQDDEVFVWSKNADPDLNESNITFESESSNATSAASSYISETPDLRDALHVDTRRGKLYYRRTIYLQVEPELKLALTLEGYPVDKLEGSHIGLFKRTFKNIVRKDMKAKKFEDLFRPQYHDLYASNGAMIYIADCIESKNYLLEILPKLISTTGLKLIVKDVKDLVRFTRVVLRLPPEISHFDSKEILEKIKLSYPGLKIELWKIYRSIIGKQKRDFGVDPASMKILKSPKFKPVFEGFDLDFTIIDRTIHFNQETQNYEKIVLSESEKKNQEILKKMYNPVSQLIKNMSLSKIRTEHYSNLISDDLKLYLAPTDYQGNRITIRLFDTIKQTFQGIVIEAVRRGVMKITELPVFHDIYLFDGVIFVICQNLASRRWIENILPSVNDRLGLNLKHTEYRGEVGIVTMSLPTTSKSPEKVVETLQIRNPKLRTKFWRIISVVQTKLNLDIVLQIDKFSAEIINSKDFVRTVGKSNVNFKLGNLEALLKVKRSVDLTTMTIKEEKVCICDKSMEDNKTSKKKKNKNKKKNGASSVTESKSTTGTNNSTQSSTADIADRQENVNIVTEQIQRKNKIDVNKQVENVNLPKSQKHIDNVNNSKKQDRPAAPIVIDHEILKSTKVEFNITSHPAKANVSDGQVVGSVNVNKATEPNKCDSKLTKNELAQSTSTSKSATEKQAQVEITKNISDVQVVENVTKNTKQNQSQPMLSADTASTSATTTEEQGKNSLAVKNSNIQDVESIQSNELDSKLAEREASKSTLTSESETTVEKFKVLRSNYDFQSFAQNGKRGKKKKIKPVVTRPKYTRYIRRNESRIQSVEYIFLVGTVQEIIDNKTALQSGSCDNVAADTSKNDTKIETTDIVKDTGEGLNDCQGIEGDLEQKDVQTLSTNDDITMESKAENNETNIDKDENKIDITAEQSSSVLLLHPEPSCNTNEEHKIILKIPKEILPEDEQDVRLIFEVLEDKNPGLQPELWKWSPLSTYDKGAFLLYVDDLSMKTINSTTFRSTVGGKRIYFLY